MTEDVIMTVRELMNRLIALNPEDELILKDSSGNRISNGTISVRGHICEKNKCIGVLYG